MILTSIDNKILLRKEVLIKNKITPISIISFLEDSIKDLIDYYFLFIDEIKVKNTKKTFKNISKISSIFWNNKKKVINYEIVNSILCFFKVNLIEKEKEILRNFFYNRNINAHSNVSTDIEIYNEKKIKYIIHKRKNVSKVWLIFYIVNELTKKIKEEVANQKEK